MKTTVTILTLLLLTSISGRLFACSCIGQRTVQEELKHADAVLAGTIVSKDLITLLDSTLLQFFQNDTTFINNRFVNMKIAKYGLFVHDIYNVSSPKLRPFKNRKQRKVVLCKYYHSSKSLQRFISLPA